MSVPNPVVIRAWHKRLGPAPDDPEVDYRPSAEFAHSLLRLVMAVRYRKNLVAAVMAAAALVGGLFYATVPRRYAAKAQLLVTQTGHDHLDTSITNEESQRQNSMPTFEKMLTSAKVLEGALKSLPPDDRVDFGEAPPERLVAALRERCTPPRRCGRPTFWRWNIAPRIPAWP